MAKECIFWLVWNPSGATPTVRHPTLEAAQREPEECGYVSEALLAAGLIREDDPA
ncbi:MAG TPA: hypothetical protein VHL34_24640 [Rhizomicrobium sp.]|jgi:hypothetical protein|nr:hypothetical protein [Rhizomicrobium sp.]